MLSPTFFSVAAFTGTAIAALASLKRRKSGNLVTTARSRSSSSVPTATKEHVLALRKSHFSKSVSVSYENTGPIMIVRGQGSRLIDESGISYLDTRNNVAHCGHGHPRVVKAVQEQVAALNTNTRYLHPTTALLAERLAGLLPDPLEIVFFCNSGSEANDLALRLARAYSGGSSNTIVIDNAYHGHTLGTLEVSPYKYECGSEYDLSPGNHIWKVPCPDTYRGEYRDPETAGAKYAQFVKQACLFYQSARQKVRAFIMEGGMSVAGVILPPRKYLNECVEAVHQAGGLYIADEVQTGFGRLGNCFWAFQYRHSSDEPEVVPDIVTMGKPFGNGMPLAAVVCSRKVAAAFESCGVEYFNTFGGNPVCAAAGMAVLDVIEEERLMQKALEVGNYLMDKFNDLSKRLKLIGDVRGSGLFLGIELVRDKYSLEPATEETSFICSVLKSKYNVLSSIDGPHDNVLVVKPPMVFSREDADYFVLCFEEAATRDLMEMGDVSKLSKTPT